MNSFLDHLSFFTSRLAWGCLRLATLGMVAMTGVILWQVWGRYVLNDTPDWAERTALLLVLYFALIAAAVGVRNRGHLNISFVQNMLPERVRYVMIIVSHLLVAGFGGGMVFYGYQLAAVTWNQTIPTIGLPAGFTYIPIPLSGALIVLFSIEHMLNDMIGRKTTKLEEQF